MELETSRAVKSCQDQIVLLGGLEEALIKVVCSSTRILVLLAQVNWDLFTIFVLLVYTFQSQ